MVKVPLKYDLLKGEQLNDKDRTLLLGLPLKWVKTIEVSEMERLKRGNEGQRKNQGQILFHKQISEHLKITHTGWGLAWGSPSASHCLLLHIYPRLPLLVSGLSLIGESLIRNGGSGTTLAGQESRNHKSLSQGCQVGSRLKEETYKFSPCDLGMSEMRPASYNKTGEKRWMHKNHQSSQRAGVFPLLM